MFSTDSVGERSGEKCEGRGGQGITRDDDAGVAWGGVEFSGDGGDEKGNQLSVGNPEKQNAEKDERDLPLKRCTFGASGHARILTQTNRGMVSGYILLPKGEGGAK